MQTTSLDYFNAEENLKTSGFSMEFWMCLFDVDLWRHRKWLTDLWGQLQEKRISNFQIFIQNWLSKKCCCCIFNISCFYSVIIQFVCQPITAQQFVNNRKTSWGSACLLSWKHQQHYKVWKHFQRFSRKNIQQENMGYQGAYLCDVITRRTSGS